jgi:hypothetical protein
MFTDLTDIKLGFYSFTTVKIVNIFSFMAVKIGKNPLNTGHKAGQQKYQSKIFLQSPRSQDKHT